MRKEFIPTIIFALLVSLLCLPAQAQISGACIDFEALADGTRYDGDDYQPGDVLFTEDDVPVAFNEFVYENGTTDMFHIDVQNLDGGFTEHPDQLGNALWVSNATATFDFSKLDYTVNRLSFEFIELGGDYNLSVNGEPVRFLNTLTDVPTEVAEDVFISFEIDDEDEFFNWGTATLVGDIESLTIGGQEFYVDHFCFEANDDFSCNISNLN
ncbi:MAG: hypothetical protein AAFP02_10915, partial [Bacteroidota bacterium]